MQIIIHVIGISWKFFLSSCFIDNANHLDANTTLVKSEIGEGALFYCPDNGSDSIQWLKVTKNFLQNIILYVGTII